MLEPGCIIVDSLEFSLAHELYYLLNDVFIVDSILPTGIQADIYSAYSSGH
jgi:hypothetical protein